MGLESTDRGSNVEFAAILEIDSTTCKAHQHAAGGKGAEENALGRSQGGIGIKLHALVDGNGIARKLFLTPGNVHDVPPAERLLNELELTGKYVLTDQGYDSFKIVNIIHHLGGMADIPVYSPGKLKRVFTGCVMS